MIADWPMQINILDRSKPLEGYSEAQRHQIMEDLRMKGVPTQDTLKLLASEETYLLRVPRSSSQPALAFSEAVIHDFYAALRENTGDAMLGESPVQTGQGVSDPTDSVWQECIPFVQERVVRAKEVV